MPEWKYTVDISTCSALAKRGSMTPQIYAKRVAVAIRKLVKVLERQYSGTRDEEKKDLYQSLELLAMDFDNAAEDDTATFDDTDIVLDELYDIGNTFRVWIRTV